MKKNYLNLDRILDIETPAVVVDRQVLDQNIARGAEIARAAGAAYRPHMKTHKSIRIAALQMAAGAVGVTAAKPSEAIIFMQRGLRDVTVAYPMIDPHKVERLMRVAQHTGSTLRLVADSMEGVEAISAASAA